jgi:CCDC81-like prokaryotic HU domain 1/CCDC81-like prokaryotic HU domain 2
MQVDIAAHIEKLLFEHETLIIPTFGGFTSTRSPAAVDFVGGAVAPPSKTLAFNENLTIDDGILVHEISNACSISNDDARRLVLDFVESTKEALNQREIVTFPGVGRLYKNYAQKIQFLPDTTNFNTDSYGLPPLQFSPVARTRDQEDNIPAARSNGTAFTPPTVVETIIPTPSSEVVSVAKEVEIAPAKPTNGYIAPPIEQTVARTQNANPLRSISAFSIGLLLFALGVGYYMMQRKKANPLVSGEKVENTNPLSVLPTSSEVLAKAEEEANKKEEAKKKAAASASNDDKDDDTADEVEEATAKKIEASKKDNSFKKSEIAKEESAPKEALPAGEKRCVLIVGTYQDKINAMKLLDKIKAAGFDTYYRIQKGHQVGIEFNYKEMVDIQNQMKALEKATGESNIWIKKK